MAVVFRVFTLEDTFGNDVAALFTDLVVASKLLCCLLCWQTYNEQTAPCSLLWQSQLSSIRRALPHSGHSMATSRSARASRESTMSKRLRRLQHGIAKTSFIREG